jgi:hypothetical protein
MPRAATHRGSYPEEEGATVVAVIPNGERGLEMRQSDDGGGVESCVDGAKVEDLGFGPAGGGASHAQSPVRDQAGSHAVGALPSELPPFSKKMASRRLPRWVTW